MTKVRSRKKKMAIVLFVCLLVAGFFLLRPGHAHIAPRTSKDFDHRPKSDELVAAASAGDLNKMTKLLGAGVSPDSDTVDNDEGVSALSAAAGNGQVSAVRLLLDRGADVNADDFWGGNALVGASLNGNVELVQLLLDHGADPNMRDDGATALGYSSFQLVYHTQPAPVSNYVKVISLLRAHGAKLP